VAKNRRFPEQISKKLAADIKYPQIPQINADFVSFPLVILYRFRSSLGRFSRKGTNHGRAGARPYRGVFGRHEDNHSDIGLPIGPDEICVNLCNLRINNLCADLWLGVDRGDLSSQLDRIVQLYHPWLADSQVLA
jgi:hypothetical protein